MLVLGGFLLLGIVATWPLATAWTTAVPGSDALGTRFDMADQDATLWAQWWGYHTLFQQHSSPFISSLLYWPTYPDGLSVLFIDLQVWRAVLTAPVQALAGLVAAYNAEVFLSFAVGGWGAWLLAREAGASRGAAVLAGVLFVAGPYHLSQLTTTVALVAIEALPFALLWGWRAARGAGPPSIILAAISMTVATLLSWYFGLLAVLGVGLMAGLVAWGARRGGIRALGPVGGRLLLMILLYGLLCSPVLLPMLGQVGRAAAARTTTPAYDPQTGSYGSFDQVFVTLNAIRAGSIHWDQLFHPRKDARFAPPQWRGAAYLGLPALALALLALVGAARARRHKKRGVRDEPPNRADPPTPNPQPPTPWWWLVVALIYLTLAMGPDLHDWNGQPVPTDWAWLQAIDQGPYVPLPYALLMRLPGMDLFRAPAHATAMIPLAVGVLVALGTDQLTAWVMPLLARLSRAFAPLASRAVRPAIVLSAGALLLAEYLTLPMPLYTPPVSQFFVERGREADSYAIMELPITAHVTNDHRRLYNQTIHHKAVPGGYLARPIPDPYRQPDSPFAQFSTLYTTTEILDQDRDGATRALLTLYDFRYLVAYLERRDYNTGTGSAAWDWPLGAPVYEDSQIRAYAVGTADLSRTWLYLGNSWQPGERQLDGSAQRAIQGPTGYVRVWSPGGAGRLALTVSSVGGPRPVRLAMDGATLVQWTTTPTAGRVQTPTLQLTRGWYTLRIEDGGSSAATPDTPTVLVSHLGWTAQPEQR